MKINIKQTKQNKENKTVKLIKGKSQEIKCKALVKEAACIAVCSCS